jgi:hypothetical protein
MRMLIVEGLERLKKSAWPVQKNWTPN